MMIQKTKIFLQNNCTIKNFLILFLIVQPIFDLKIFYSSISTLIRVFFVVLFFLYYFINSKNKKKYFLLIYPLLILIYFIFHHLNALNFTSVVPGNFNYSIFQEALYFVKMICPYLLIYSLFKSNISKKEIYFILKTLVLEISLIIIISNLFIFSYGSYSDAKIKANFLEWFNPNSSYTYKDLCSKGLFEAANQISATLLMFLPFIILLNLENKSKINLFILICNVLALLFLGTKVAVFGILIVFFYSSLGFIILKKQIKKLFILIPCILIYICLLPFNPTFSRISENKTVIETSLEVPVNQDAKSISEETFSAPESKEEYILKYYSQNNINENFVLNRYPYQYDADFWYEILTSNNPLKSNYRFLETAMVKRVISINNNKLDYLFGITYTRIQNIFNIEKDFVMQYYSLGIIGLVLILGPYFIILFYWTIKMFLSKLKELNLFSSVAFITICMIFFVSYYSGNLLNSLGFEIYLSLIITPLILRSKNG